MASPVDFCLSLVLLLSLLIDVFFKCPFSFSCLPKYPRSSPAGQDGEGHGRCNGPGVIARHEGGGDNGTLGQEGWTQDRGGLLTPPHGQELRRHDYHREGG